MAPLILHVGYGKAGSTSLQRSVFRFLPDALVPGPGDREIRPLYRWMALGPRAKVDPSHVRLLERWLDGPGPRVLSEESLLGVRSNRRRSPLQFRSWSPASNLAAALRRLGVETECVHIVLGIRPQAEWIPSAFAEAPPRMNLERWLTELLQIPVEASWNPLNYLGVAESLAGLVGRAQVHILPLHAIGTDAYWSELARGTGLDPSVLGRLWSENGSRSNQRRTSESTWVANRPMTLRGRLAVDLKEYPTVRRLLIHPANLPVRALSAATTRPVPRVELDDRSRSDITQRFAEQNRRLADSFEVDLEGAGYW